MLQLLSSGIISLWLEAAGVSLPPALEESSSFLLLRLEQRESQGETLLQQYLEELSQRGFAEDGQGVWIQSERNLLGQSFGDQPLPAASLTKVATSLVALETWGPQHQFVTQIGATGPIRHGVLEGDLVIQGSGDPLFVWEEAFSLGNTLNQLGITQVTGNLVIVGYFAMNYETDPAIAGDLLREGLNAKLWNPGTAAQFATLPLGTPQPRVEILGQVQSTLVPPAPQTLLIHHRSLPLFELLKQMNIYSNNEMAEILATSLGGGLAVARRAAAAAQVPDREIQLINGSGLGHENRISPRAATGMFQAIQGQLQRYNLTIADLFPMMGRDQGTVELRQLPPSAVVKTGTLWDVSALAGVIPTVKYGPVWFAIINRGEDIEGFRNQQDQLLQSLTQQWGKPEVLLPELRFMPGRDRLGDLQRNQILWQQPRQTP